jgi:hypothetical protein
MTPREVSGALSTCDIEPVCKNALGEVFVEVVIVQLILMTYSEDTNMTQLRIRSTYEARNSAIALRFVPRPSFAIADVAPKCFLRHVSEPHHARREVRRLSSRSNFNARPMRASCT